MVVLTTDVIVALAVIAVVLILILLILLVRKTGLIEIGFEYDEYFIFRSVVYAVNAISVRDGHDAKRTIKRMRDGQRNLLILAVNSMKSDNNTKWCAINSE